MKKLAMFLTAAALTIFSATTTQAQEVAANSSSEYSGASAKYHNAHDKHDKHHNHHHNHYKKVCNYNQYEVYCESGNPFLLKRGQKYFAHSQWRCDFRTYYKFHFDGNCFYVCYDSRRNNWYTSNQCPKGYGGR